MLEHRIILPGGKVRWQQWSDRAIFDEQGKVREYQSVGRDITDQKTAEDELRRAYEELTAAEEEMRAQFEELEAPGGCSPGERAETAGNCPGLADPPVCHRQGSHG